MPVVKSSMTEVVFKQIIICSILDNKATVPDRIRPVILKTCAPKLTPVLCVSVSFASLKIWNNPRVQPIPKKLNKTLLAKYRPIAPVSALSKVMEKASNSQLFKYLENFNH